jgi:uroporphyrinogen decarboxylase
VEKYVCIAFMIYETTNYYYISIINNNILDSIMNFIKTLNGELTKTPPIWIMRQAGRYLQSYRNVRKTERNFIEFCLNPEKASNVTCQPIQKFGMDAAIIFSDILLILHMLDYKVTFVNNEGPKLHKLELGELLLPPKWDTYLTNLQPVSEAIKLTRVKLDKSKNTKDTPIIGFSGSPWTLFTYLIEGGSSKDFPNARKFLWADHANSKQIFDILTHAIIHFLELQMKAGVNAIMLFDSWAGSIPARFRNEFVYQPTKTITQTLRQKYPRIPIICLPKSIGEGIVEFVDIVQPNCVAVDHLTDIEFVHKSIPKEVVIQGNIDPLCLVTGGDVLKKEVDYLLNLITDRPYIFNLGHGIVPETPEQNVAEIISYIREKKIGLSIS